MTSVAAHLSRLVLLGLLGLIAGNLAPAQAAERDYTFLVLSDTHFGAEHPRANPPVTSEQVLRKVQANLERMRRLPGESYPSAKALADLQLGTVAIPRGLFILGDLVDGNRDPAQARQQWAQFEQVFPRAGVSLGGSAVPVFAIAGNHDGDPAGPTRQGLVERNRALHAAGRLAAISDNGAHFAINWDGLHLVCVNLCAADSTDEQTPFRFGKPGPNSWNDPQLALSFLASYLRQHVGASGQPVMLMQHYGFDGFSLGDWYWWTAAQRRAMYDLLADYNIIAIVHGHNHRAEHYRWPDPKRHAEDLAAMFGEQIPASPRQYTIISCADVCWVFRIRGNRLIAAHLRDPNWSTTPAPFVWPLEPDKQHLTGDARN
jgi:3',5'-cyclic AMP phosphodiesterase CpdA